MGVAVSPAQILSLGSINLDLQMKSERWPEGGETLMATDFLMLGGGKAANVAFLAARLGALPVLLGHVGDDPLGDLACAPLAEAGIDLSRVKRVAGVPTGLSHITVRPDGQKHIVLAPNANDCWTRLDAEETARVVAGAPPGSVLVLDLEIPGAVVKEALEAARRRGLTIVLDPSPAGRVTSDLLHGVDFVLPNPPEAKRLTGRAITSLDQAFLAGADLCARGARNAVVKLSGGGAALVGPGLRAHLEVPRRVEVVDATGAGDAFAGAFGVALLEGKGPEEATRFAVAAATCAVTAYGSQPSYPTREALERMLEGLAQPASEPPNPELADTFDGGGPPR